MAHERWQAGRLSTGFIAEEFPEGFIRSRPRGRWPRPSPRSPAAIDHVLGERKRRISGQMTGREVTRERRRAVRLGGKPDDPWLSLDVAREGRGHRRAFRRNLRRRWPGAGAVVVLEARRSGVDRSDRRAVGSRCRCGRSPTVSSLAHRGVEVRAFVYTECEATAARLMPVKKAPDTGKWLLCPMPGLVRSIEVKEGQEVKVGETLAVVEAMKMENVLRAERDAVVKAIKVKPGDSLAVDAVIMEFA
jgi:propionyl-CoA carboxylase alpha chain